MSTFPAGQAMFSSYVRMSVFSSLGAGDPAATVYGDLNPIPANLNITSIALHTSPGVAANRTIQPNIGGTPSGSGLTLTTGQTDGIATVAVVVPQTTSLATALTNGLLFTVTPSSLGVTGMLGVGYSFDSPFNHWQMVASGVSGNASLGFTNTDVIQALCSTDQRILSGGEHQTQLSWSIPGTFKYLIAYVRPQFGVGLPQTVDLRFRVNGVTQIQLSPSVSGETLVTDTTTSVHVNAGDLVTFAGHVGSTFANTMNLYFALGFLPD